MTLPRLPALALLASLALPLPAAGQAPEPAPAAPAGATGPREVAFLLRMGMDFGGATLVKVSWDNGETGSVKAGQLFALAMGVYYWAPAAPWALEATAGYKFDRVNGSNGSITFSRLPVELIASYVNSGFRIGAGPAVHLSPRFNCEATGVCSGSVTLRNAVGGVVQAAYGGPLLSGLDAGVRYTFVRYKDDAGASLDGSAFGFVLGYRF